MLEETVPTMQIFVKLPSARTLVVEVEEQGRISHIADRVCEVEGICPDQQRLTYGGKQLDQEGIIMSSNLREGATIHVLLRLLGGAAARLKKLAMEENHRREMEAEYSTWHKLADQTETTGVMRLLCVSLVLEKNKSVVHGEDSGENGTEAQWHYIYCTKRAILHC